MVNDFAQTVKQQADIVRIIGEYVRLRKAGAQNFSGLCPFHTEKSPSFSVHAGRQFYHCFGCGQSGDVFSFIQKLENVGFPEAVKIVAQKCGIPLPKREFSSPEEAAESRQRGKLIELHEVATKWFEEQLRGPEGATAREYLTGRGLNEQGIAKFRMGYAPDSFHALRELLQPMADQETLRLSGLFSFKEQEDGKPGPLYARFRKRVMFPISNESGRVIAFTARALESGDKAGPKYLNSPETPLYSKGQVLFNLDKARQPIREANFALLVEGQMDCISAYLAGITNVLATSGTAFTEAQVRLLSRYTTQVLVNFDPDTAGANAAEKSIALLTEEGFTIKVVALEDGLDPDRYIRERGAKEYMAALRGARRIQDFLIERAQMLFPPTTPEAKLKGLNFLLPHICRMPNRVLRQEFASDAATALKLDSTLVREEFKEAALKRRDAMPGLQPQPRTYLGELTRQAPVTTERSQTHRLTDSEKMLLWAFSLPMASEAYRTADSAYQKYEDDFAKMRSDVYLIVTELRNRVVGTDPISVLTNGESRQILASALISAYNTEPEPHDVEAAIRAIRRTALEQEQRTCRNEIVVAEREGNAEQVRELSKKMLEISIKLRGLI